MKKISLALILMLVCAVVLCSCGKEETPYDYDLTEYVTLGTFPNVEFDEDELIEKLDAEIETIASEYAEVVEVTGRAVQDGDTVNIDYVGKINGEEFEGGSAEGTDLEIGSGTFIAGFEDGLIGKNIGDEVELNLVFPEDYENNPDLAGEDVVFTVKINSISASEIPALTDDMVAEKTAYSTITEYMEETRRELAETMLWDNYVASCKILKYPQAETKKYYDNLVTSYNQMAVYNGMTLEEMVTSFYGYSTLDEFLTYVMDMAMDSVKEEMIIYLTVKEHDISLTDEEYENLGEELAVEAGYETLEEYEEVMTEEGIKLQIYMDKIIEKAYEANGITFEPVEEEIEETDTEETTDETTAETQKYNDTLATSYNQMADTPDDTTAESVA